MEKQSLVGIIGRVNVGKSSLLNALARRSISIVDATPGTTRDVVSALITYQGITFEVVDTGGFYDWRHAVLDGHVSKTSPRGGEDPLLDAVLLRVDEIIQKADQLLFVVDIRTGLTDLDLLLAQRVHRLRKSNTPRCPASSTPRRLDSSTSGMRNPAPTTGLPDRRRPTADSLTPQLLHSSQGVLAVANKVDHPDLESSLSQVRSLGFGEPVAISCTHRRGLDTLLQELTSRIASSSSRLPDSPTADSRLLTANSRLPDSSTNFIPRISVVGKRNAGKSTFVNALLRETRMIVSDQPGTTRDAVEIPFVFQGQPLRLVDTAGLFHKRSAREKVEAESLKQSFRAIHRSDGVLFLLDGTQPVSTVDKQLSGFLDEEGKPTVIVLNKWDLLEKQRLTPGSFQPYIQKTLSVLSYAPLSFVSSLQGRHVEESVALLLELIAQGRHRAHTALLNLALAHIHKTVPLLRGRRLAKIYYGTQTGTAPPEIVLFVNRKKLFSPSLLRTLKNQLRRLLPYSEVPLRIKLKEKEKKET